MVGSVTLQSACARTRQKSLQTKTSSSSGSLVPPPLFGPPHIAVACRRTLSPLSLLQFRSGERRPWLAGTKRDMCSWRSRVLACSLGSDAGCCSSPMYCLVSAEVRFGSVSRVPWVPTRGVAPPQCTAWFPKREPIGDEEHTAAEPLGKARGTQAEPKRNPRRVLVRRCFRVEEPKGGNRNPGRNPASLLVRLGLRGRAPLRGIYYYYRGGRAPQGATRRCAPALYRGPGPKRVASQSCQVVFRTCLNQTGSNST